jgi:hypothetical protein
MRAIIGALAIAMLAGPAAAQSVERADSLTLRLGETALIELDPSGQMLIVERGQASPFSDDDMRMLRAMLAGALGPAVGPDSAPIPASPESGPTFTRANALRMSFVEVPDGGGVVLRIENGYDRGLEYRAAIFADFRTTSTDVCTVRPLLRGYEHWPYPIMLITMSDARLFPWSEGQRVVCR